MEEKFGRDYFYGNKESNYYNYDTIDASLAFKSGISFIKDNNFSGGRILDVGCAFGIFLEEVDPFFDKIYGCDISKFAIEKAKEKLPEADFKVVDVEKSLPYEDDFFDCITAFDVLEHTKNLEKSFENIVSKLKDGGYLIMSMPINCWPRKIFGFLDKDKTHISILKGKELVQIINKNELEIIKKDYFLPFPIVHKISGIPAEVEFILRK
jgi:2-polyprenyl-3-methyl-5-hydroxy-6-metoxy-1,4-benzoquinol methylase